MVVFFYQQISPWVDENQYYQFLQPFPINNMDPVLRSQSFERQPMCNIPHKAPYYESLCRKCRCTQEYPRPHESGIEEYYPRPHESEMEEQHFSHYDFVEEPLLIETSEIPDLGLTPSFSELFIDDPRTRSEKNQVKSNDVSNKDIKKVIRKRAKSNWTKMSKELFYKMVEYEKEHGTVKQCEMEKIFNVNRSTYWRWKKQFNLC